jgi:hypothetical protein
MNSKQYKNIILIKKTNNLRAHNSKFFLRKTQIFFSVLSLRPVCTESLRPGLSLKLGLKPQNDFKSYVYLKILTEFRLKPGLNSL